MLYLTAHYLQKPIRQPMNKNQDLYETIYDIVRLIPKGRVSSYGAIAAAIGMKSGARLVGYAMNHAHSTTPKVPAHRVVNRNGMLTGKHHFGNANAMQNLLEKEGIKVKDDCVVDFEKIIWNPAQELAL
jgi:methylated-DNA-protein-cysteine methyltransferase-like protein